MTRLARVPTNRNALVAQIELRGPHRRKALRARLSTTIEVLTGDQPGSAATAKLLDTLAVALRGGAPDQIWLALAVISGRLPSQDTVLRAVRIARLDGPLAALAEVLTVPSYPLMVPGRAWPTVRVLTDQVLVDVHDTARTEVATGIQRVARQTARRWQRDHDITLIGWTADDASLRALSPVEQDRALGRADDQVGSRADGRGERGADEPPTEIIVPWRCRYLLPELIAEPKRNFRLQSLLRFSGNHGSSIGFDMVPLTSAETTAEGMGQGFSTALVVTARLDRVATISAAAATEYGGWREMLAGPGLDGPQIKPIELATEPVRASAESIEAARVLLDAGELPVVLCVGSHEPRKNHLAVMHAAELLWREGLQFALVFIGGNAWRDDLFIENVARLQDAGRPVVSARALSDDVLWASYHLAHCVVFPSLNEGFGLPIAESLACGTPVVTSGFGSMREIARHGGAILVDPRDDHDIAAGLRLMLTDRELHETLSRQARARPVRTWDDYAREVWDYLTGAEIDAPSAAADAPTGAAARSVRTGAR